MPHAPRSDIPFVDDGLRRTKRHLALFGAQRERKNGWRFLLFFRGGALVRHFRGANWSNCAPQFCRKGIAMLSQIAKFLILGGAVMLFSGLALLVVARFFPAGLPGDISAQRGGVSFFFPVVTCIVLSVIATVVLNVLARFFGR